MSIADDAVEVEFGVSEANCGGTDVLISVETVSANRHSNAVWFSFAWAHGADEIGVGNLATSRNLMRINKDHGVVSEDLFRKRARFRETLSAAGPFIGQGFGPNERVGATEERINGFNLAGLGVVHFAGDRGVVLKRLDEGVATMGARIKVETGKADARAFAKKRKAPCERRLVWKDRSWGFGRDRHIRKGCRNRRRKWNRDVQQERWNQRSIGWGHPRKDDRGLDGERKRRWSWRMNSTAKDIGNFGVSVEDGRTESERRMKWR